MNILTKSLIFVVAIFGAVFWYYNHTIHTPINESDSEIISFRIENGQSPKQVARDLEENGLIRSSTTFYYYLKSNDLGSEILAGRFLLSKNMDVPEIVETISTLSSSETVITIQEGLTVEQIDNKLVELGLIQKGEFIAAVNQFDDWEYYGILNRDQKQGLSVTLEGYIYPDTYFLDPVDFAPEDLIYRSLNNFNAKLDTLNLESSEIYQKYSFHEILTMASIIEREVFGLEDKKLVSGLLWKRLENGWTIGADATLLYITEDNVITSSELQIDSPYNTRKNLGLPPGPIANPSIESLEAALFPTDSEYWFYLTTLDTGEVIYSRTNEEHNQNRAIHLQ